MKCHHTRWSVCIAAAIGLIFISVAVFLAHQHDPEKLFSDLEIMEYDATDSSQLSDIMLHQFRPCSVYVPCVGNMGTQILSFLYGMHIAKTMSSIVLLACERNGLMGSYSEFLVNFTATANSCESHTIDLHGPTQQNVLIRPTAVQARDLAVYLHDVVDFDAFINYNISSIISKDSCLTIYLRTGDIFHSAHNQISQAPCAYYHYILETMEVEHIVVVITDDESDNSHPCLRSIVKYQGVFDVRVVDTSIEESFAILVQAKRLILPGHTSFGFTAALMGKNRAQVVIPVFESHSREVHFPDFRWMLPPKMEPNVTVDRLLIRNFEIKLGESLASKMHSVHATVSRFDMRQFLQPHVTTLSNLNGHGDEVISMVQPVGIDRWSPTLNTLNNVHNHAHPSAHMKLQLELPRVLNSYTLVVHGLTHTSMLGVVERTQSLREYAAQFYFPLLQTWHLGGMVIPTCLEDEAIGEAKELFADPMTLYLTAFLRLPAEACSQSWSGNFTEGLSEDLSDSAITAFVINQLNPFNTTHAVGVPFNPNLSVMLAGIEQKIPRNFFMGND